MTPSLFLDANATTPCCPAARAAALRLMEQCFGNPSSSHSEGLRARHELERARRAARQAIGAGTGRCIFTSGATEAIHTAVFSALLSLRQRREAGQAIAPLLLVGATEHKAVLQAVSHWNEALGLNLEVRLLPVDAQGRHELARLREWLPQTALLCTMAANNETGVISDIAGIEAVLRAAQSPALWLVDSVQALGKLALNLDATRIDYASFSGHKLYAPKGVGLLYVREGSPYHPLMVGGGQESEQRSGTENLPGIAGFGAVFEALNEGRLFASADRLEGYRRDLVAALNEAFPGLEFNAPLDLCLPTTLNFALPGASSKQLMNLLDASGVQVSAGSACSAGKAAGSHVLDAMARPDWASRGAIRLSFGPMDEPEFIAQCCAALRRAGEVWARLSEDCKAAEAGAALLSPTEESAEDCIDLGWQDLAQHLRQQPETLLIDVREAYEQQAGLLPCALSELPQLHLPLSRFAQELTSRPELMQRPVLLLCRSGKRSREAALHLLALGHGAVWQLAGGLALCPRPQPA
ncbi:MAG: aminotransferase class V-fold PLP-dependent enzyme [Roseateles asaccharophilus]|uniref:aminotransferase class V-fold PLP-dependent enzyme n=1 Tax=Roseateles asaccharophilus TaxID=582607 RepID=UPI00391A2776